jgi:hypothetical protein
LITEHEVCSSQEASCRRSVRASPPPLGRLLKARGLKVQMQKFDPYQLDPGTMSRSSTARSS